MATTTLLVGGGGSYPLADATAVRLAGLLRHAYPETLDRNATALEFEVAQRGRYLAELLEVEAANETTGEPVELGRYEMEALSGALRDFLAAGDEQLQKLYNAVRKFRGEPEFHGWRE